VIWLVRNFSNQSDYLKVYSEISTFSKTILHFSCMGSREDFVGNHAKKVEDCFWKCTDLRIYWLQKYRFWRELIWTANILWGTYFSICWLHRHIPNDTFFFSASNHTSLPSSDWCGIEFLRRWVFKDSSLETTKQSCCTRYAKLNPFTFRLNMVKTRVSLKRVVTIWKVHILFALILMATIGIDKMWKFYPISKYWKFWKKFLFIFLNEHQTSNYFEVKS